MEAGCSEAEGVERDTKTRMWALPPVVPFGLLMQRLEAWLRRVLRDDRSARREEARGGWVDGTFLGERDTHKHTQTHIGGEKKTKCTCTQGGHERVGLVVSPSSPPLHPDTAVKCIKGTTAAVGLDHHLPVLFFSRSLHRNPHEV